MFHFYPERLRERRNKLGISIRRLAELANISHPTVIYIERGIRQPRIGTLLRLARALKVRPTYFLRKR